MFYNELTTENEAKYGHMINQENIATQLVIIYEGTFVGYDPANGDDYGAITSFLYKGSSNQSTSAETSSGSNIWV